VKNERLQAALDYQNEKLRHEDCIRRLENRALALKLEEANANRPEQPNP
jgi:hypothetical protein